MQETAKCTKGMEMNNYPDGAANDPSAPWNQKDPKIVVCEECNGSGEIINDDGNFDCDECKGEGQIESDEEDDDWCWNELHETD